MSCKLLITRCCLPARRSRGLRDFQLVQSGTRTRVILNLDRPLKWRRPKWFWSGFRRARLFV